MEPLGPSYSDPDGIVLFCQRGTELLIHPILFARTDVDHIREIRWKPGQPQRNQDPEDRSHHRNPLSEVVPCCCAGKTAPD